MKNFSKISEINLQDDNSWGNKVFLTFDLDWCSDFVLDYTINILEEKNVPATFFVTHNTDLLDRIKKNPLFELGIHPNFNFLLNGDFRVGKNIKEVVSYYKKIVPDAVSVRSHSMTQNSSILQHFLENDITYNCNYFIPHNLLLELKPWKYWNGQLINVPHFWEDDIQVIENHNNPNYHHSMDFLKTQKGLKVFDFHPIHIFLNTEKIERYESSRKFHADSERLIDFKNHLNLGAEKWLLQLIDN